ncbi:hypothetical protein bwei_1687 [Bacillus mycoides]|uniref:UPF0489 family protein n=1 Tax=Bacillus mycoides TaxID=1405 RepID=UPI0001A057B5|nr:UPF0489 family protein [Bacillus mycoides]AIW84334.1 hypothetical protein bwei_1687 [Bacillus mycoides]EEL06132.1 hypothetical protein bcere0014_22290 [Bacillus cereus BDRD-ST196]GAE42911.1 hypothetical protein BW1_076_00660 [Bacillus mycoides NBRC 101238 = DSM 11821]HDR7595993.1 UPF0489 family protein [Bacillus mycoides]
MIPKDFRRCFPEQNIFVSCEHNWAFAAWELHKRAGNLKPNATLIHVDAHLDDVWDGLTVEGLQDIKNPEDVFNVTKNMKIDNFIWPAVGTGTIDKVIYVSQQNYGDEPFNFESWNLDFPDLKPVKEILDDGKYIGLRYWNIEEFVDGKDSDEVKILTGNKDLILDLDLDYFNGSEREIRSDNLMDEQKIIDNLTTLRDLYPWSLITVALSPFYCGGEDNAKYLLDLFFKVFGVNPDDAMSW